ncbi:hypothetical protein CEXT_217472 [Caerostris extrusa]|uniref:Uncharacterized protein n=1 Tax=Caerostris extrusa TaxID=172846 RepID=A0AAV4XS46_CAEEX|nr:hypothetical protein CEXT_217472 [Caerostris extrusa]
MISLLSTPFAGTMSSTKLSIPISEGRFKCSVVFDYVGRVKCRWFLPTFRLPIATLHGVQRRSLRTTTPAHMGIPPVTIDPKTENAYLFPGIPRPPVYHLGPPGQYPPVFSPEFTHQLQWYVLPLIHYHYFVPYLTGHL